MNKEHVLDALKSVQTPDGSQDVVAAGWVKDIEFEDGDAIITLTLDGLSREQRHSIEDAVVKAANGAGEFTEVYVEVEVSDLELPQPAQPKAAEPGLSVYQGEPKVKPRETALSRVKNLIGVASGKGGVGKSTVTANLAAALKGKGHSVGVCDIDIYGPSIPIQLGVVDAKPGVSNDQKRFEPVDAYGMKVMSIGFLVDDDTPVIWRGPIVGSVVKQFLEDVEWGELDYLIIDMPPGTGDAQLTLSQTAPLTAAVIVTTPSQLALVDAQKGLQMFRKVDVPVLGLIENMSHHVCGKCGHESQPFNQGGTDSLADKVGVDILTRVPLDHDIQRGSDEGKPVVISKPKSPQSESFSKLADVIIDKCPPGAKTKKGLLSGIFGR